MKIKKLTIEGMLDEMEYKREARKEFAERFRRRNLNENEDDEDLSDTFKSWRRR